MPLNLKVHSEEANRYWRRFLAETVGTTRPIKPQPSALGIKVPTHRALMDTLAIYIEAGDQVHIGPVDGRSIATIRKAKPYAFGTMRHVKILQRRPRSSDRLGLEHMDLLVPAQVDLVKLGQQYRDIGVACKIESNDAHTWLSIEYEDPSGKQFEFKLVREEVWAVCVTEMVT